ncbi:hypothetical protein [Arthrobacter silvisoli]|uniref:hypothetical protein n=1 Tax=Arthrobacter silvisoli TaxID=2291022 RepID=UPI001B3538DD|nr:hypothetical protein [Arthrobacter silvisoli]
MLTSFLRTIVPALWGSFVGWLLGLLPILEPLRPQLIEYSTPLTAIVGAVIIAAWYALWRWLEPLLPVWLVRAVLGSAKAPVYPSKAIAETIDAEGVQTYRPSVKTPGPDHRA